MGTETANDRFKARFDRWMWASVAVAVAAHAAAFAFSPRFQLEGGVTADGDLVTVDVVPEVQIPDPPAPIRRPATPKFVADISDPPILAPNVFYEDRPVPVAPPPAEGDDDLAAAPRWTPMDIAPRVRDERALQAAMLAHYPPILRDAGIGGVVRLWFFVDETGRVVRVELKESSGLEALDAAAIRVARDMEFVPAYRKDRPVSVWVALELQFTSN